MKKILYLVAGVAALGSLGWFGTWVSGQQPGTVQPAVGTNKPVTKIGVMNIAKVLKNFTNANALGDQLIREAQDHENSLNLKKQELKKKELEIAAMPKGAAQDEAAKKLHADSFAVQELEIEFRKKLSERQSEMAGTVMKSIDHIVDFLAKQNGLEMVLAYPDATTDEEAKSPPNAIRRLSAPAATVIWKNPGLDISDEVVRYLNHYYPAPANYKPPAGGVNLATPPSAPPQPNTAPGAVPGRP